MASHLPLYESRTLFLHDLHLQPHLLDLIAIPSAHTAVPPAYQAFPTHLFKSIEIP